MNEAIINNHNTVVKPNDLWYYFGDLAMAGRQSVVNLLKRLNGVKHMIAGNHDKRILFRRDNDFNLIVKDDIINEVKWIKDYHEMWINDPILEKQFVVLSHYAMRTWNGSNRDSYMLHGHSHNSLPDDPNLLSIDVGIDATAARLSKNKILRAQDYRPISFDEVRSIMKKRKAIKIMNNLERKK